MNIDYEGAWKELKDNFRLSDLFLHMDIIEKSYTFNCVELEKDVRRESDNEIVNLIIGKYTKLQMENIHLKRKIKKLSKGKNKFDNP